MYVEAKVNICSRLPSNLENKHVIFLINFLLKSSDFEPPINYSWGTPTRASRSPLTPLENNSPHPPTPSAGSDIHKDNGAGFGHVGFR